jgi:alpha-beta hydrolase superfamily lysophospholipase
MTIHLSNADLGPTGFEPTEFSKFPSRRKRRPCQSRRTVALVHGAFAESASWNPVIEQLQARGLEAVAVANPLRSVAGDAATGAT